jgi:hypothetical protein
MRPLQLTSHYGVALNVTASGKLRELWRAELFAPRSRDLPPASFTAPIIRGRSSKLNLEFVSKCCEYMGIL